MSDGSGTASVTDDDGGQAGIAGSVGGSCGHVSSAFSFLAASAGGGAPAVAGIGLVGSGGLVAGAPSSGAGGALSVTGIGFAGSGGLEGRASSTGAAGSLAVTAIGGLVGSGGLVARA
jgi:hypothetical protein